MEHETPEAARRRQDNEALARIYKALDARWEQVRRETALGENAPARKLISAVKRQFLAIIIGLPRGCRHEACRRHRTCAYRGAPCLAEHRKIAEARLAELAGFASSGSPRQTASTPPKGSRR